MASGASLPKIGYYWVLYLAKGILMTTGVRSGLTFQAGYTLAGIKPPLQGLTSKDAQGAISLQNISQIGGTPLWLLTSGQIFQSLAFVNLGKALGGRGYTTAQICSAVAGTQSSLFKELSAELAAASAITEAIRRVLADEGESLCLPAGGAGGG
ncbi:hypothetical protein MW887_008044 [Aspergillus wentii]|nr:hypothetical protein MW887_008044 [Aspergillus wentii]